MNRRETVESSPLPDADEAIAILKKMAACKPACSARRVDKPLALYGAGDLGQMAQAYFNTLAIPFRCAVDAQADRYADHPAWRGVSVLKPGDVTEQHRRECLLAVCIATARYTDIAEALAGQGWSDIVPFYDITEAYVDRYPINNGWFAGQLTDEDLRETGAVLRTWTDDLSRAHHLQFIAWHLLREDLVFPQAPVNTQNRYFIPEIINALQEDEVFLDGGAHHGDVSFRFAKLAQNRFQKIYAVEPDPENVQIFSARLKDTPPTLSRSIDLRDVALGKETGNAPFAGGLGYASQFGLRGGRCVKVKTIDEMNLPATFIKLHLEGWEYDALLGALKTLHHNRPMLAVTTYHNRDGLWRAYSLLMKKLADYVFLLRLHAWMGTGCVFYAIPRERFKAAAGKMPAENRGAVS